MTSERGVLRLAAVEARNLPTLVRKDGVPEI